MSESAGNNIPWTSIAVLAAFVSSTFLVPHAFERMRPPEKERAQPAVSNELEADAGHAGPTEAAKAHRASRRESAEVPAAARRAPAVDERPSRHGGARSGQPFRWCRGKPPPHALCDPFRSAGQQLRAGECGAH